MPTRKKSLFKRVLKHSGMSMIQVMIAAGLSAGVALTVAKIIQNLNRSVNSINTRVDYGRVFSDINSILTDEVNCMETLKGISFTGATSTTVLPVNSVQRCTRTTKIDTAISSTSQSINRRKCVDSTYVSAVYNSTDAYGNDTFRMSFNVEDIDIEEPYNATTGDDGRASGSFTVRFAKTEKGENTGIGKGEIKKNIFISLEFNSSGEVTSCNSSETNMVNLAVFRSCQNGVVKGAGTQADPYTCWHNQGQSNSCSSSEFLDGYTISDGTDGSDRGTLIPICTDIMNKSPSCTNGQYLIRGPDGTIDCRTVPVCNGTGAILSMNSVGVFTCNAIPLCKVNEFLRTDPSTGNLICQPIPCDSTNQYFAGFSSSGDAVCKNFPNDTCGEGEYIVEIKPDGTTVCDLVPNHLGLPQIDYSFVDGFDIDTNSWSRKTIAETAEKVCDLITDHEWNGTRCTRRYADNSYRCGTGTVMTGLTSYGYPLCERFLNETQYSRTFNFTRKYNLTRIDVPYGSQCWIAESTTGATELVNHSGTYSGSNWISLYTRGYSGYYTIEGFNGIDGGSAGFATIRCVTPNE